MFESVSSKNYLIAFVIVMACLLGAVVFFYSSNRSGTAELWEIELPGREYVAKDEFVPISFTYTPSSAVLGNTREGNFWIVLVGEEDETMHVLPVYPREIPNLIERDAVNVVHFGSAEFPMNTPHTFSGYAYLSPLIFNGTYTTRIVFGRTEEGKSPVILSQGEERSLNVERTFQTRKSLLATSRSTAIKKNSDDTYTLLQFSLSAAVDDVMLRAFEAGVPGIRRVPDPIMTLSLYDAKTGEKVSDLTNMKLSAQTIEQFTPYVLDAELMIHPHETRELELRAVVDESRLDSNGNVSFSIPRLYGINTEQFKIAEQVELKVVGKISQ